MMQQLGRWRLGVLLVLAAGILLLTSVAVDAQCSMCRAALSGSNNGRFIRSLNLGVLVLLVPPVSIFCTIFFVLRRHRGENLDPALESQGHKGGSE